MVFSSFRLSDDFGQVKRTLGTAEVNKLAIDIYFSVWQKIREYHVFYTRFQRYIRLIAHILLSSLLEWLYLPRLFHQVLFELI